jgi:hypothetical protein
MRTLQPRASGADCAVADVPGAIAVTRLANAHAKSKELIMRLTSFIFIGLISFYLVFLVLAFFDFSPWENYFWPFTGVQNGKQREVTGKCRVAALNRLLSSPARGG